MWYKVRVIGAVTYRHFGNMVVAGSIGAALFSQILSADTHYSKPPMEHLLENQSVDTTRASIRYLGNEGVLIRLPEGNILIDGLFGNGLKEYPIVEPATRDSLEQALGEFAAVDLVLVTHGHADHFDAKAVEKHMLANPSARLVASEQVIDVLEAESRTFDMFRNRVVALDSRPGLESDFVVSGVRVRAFGVSHPLSRTEPLGHLVYVVGDAQTVVHLGDVSLDSAGIESLETAPPIHVLLAPYWVISEEGVRQLQALVDATCLAGFHVALGQEDRIRTNLEESAPDTILLTGQPATEQALASCFN